MSTTWYKILSTALISSSFVPFVIELIDGEASTTKSRNCFGGGKAISSQMLLKYDSQPETTIEVPFLFIVNI